MKAQTSMEIIVILTIIMLVSLVVIKSELLNVRVINELVSKEDKGFWEIKEIGIKAIVVNNSGTYIFIQNNMREDINVQEVFVNGVDLNVDNITSSYIEPGDVGRFNSSFVDLGNNVKIRVEYIIDNIERSYTNRNSTFRTIRN